MKLKLAEPRYLSGADIRPACRSCPGPKIAWVDIVRSGAPQSHNPADISSGGSASLTFPAVDALRICNNRFWLPGRGACDP